MNRHNILIRTSLTHDWCMEARDFMFSQLSPAHMKIGRKSTDRNTEISNVKDRGNRYSYSELDTDCLHQI